MEKIKNNNNENYSTYYGEKGYSIFKECLSIDEQHFIRNELTVQAFVPKSPVQYPSFPIYLESPLKLYIPRYFGIDTYGPPDKILIEPGDNINVEFQGELRQYQIDIVEKYIKHVGSFGGGLLDVDPGKGKTVMALNIISRLKKSTLVVVHKSFLLNQWKERIQQFLPTATMGTIQGQIIDIKDKDIVIGMLQSLSMKEYPKSIFRQFGLVIFDECFPYDTYIKTNNGFIKIGELYEKWENNQDLPLILSFNENNKNFEYQPCTFAWKKQRKDLLNIYLNNCNFICTPEHKILTISGYKPASQLKNNDLIICYKNNNISYNYLIKKEYLQNNCINNNVYDIEVQFNHNFIIKANNNEEYPVVSNCHHMGAEVFSRCMMKVNTTYALGLSGTMQRKDGLTKVFEWFLGPVVHKEKTESEHKVLVKGIVYYVDDEEFNKTLYDYKGNPKFSTMISNVCNYNHRSEFILRVLIRELELNSDQQIMVLAHNKSLISYLFHAIEHRNIANGSVGLYIGGMKEVELKKSEVKKIIIATYAMASEGLDIKSLTTLVLASPKTDVCQSVGRILRQKHSSPLIIDIIDSHDIFMSQWLKRRKYYKSQNYRILLTDNKNYDEDLPLEQWKISNEPNDKTKKGKKNIIQNKTKLDEIIENMEKINIDVNDIDFEEEEQELEKKKKASKKRGGLENKCLIDISSLQFE